MKDMKVIGFVIFSFFGFYSELCASEEISVDNLDRYKDLRLVVIKSSGIDTHPARMELKDDNQKVYHTNFSISFLKEVEENYELIAKEDKDTEKKVSYSVKIPFFVKWQPKASGFNMVKRDNEHLSETMYLTILMDDKRYKQLTRFCYKQSICDFIKKNTDQGKGNGPIRINLLNTVEIVEAVDKESDMKIKLIYDSFLCSLLFINDSSEKKSFLRLIPLSMECAQEASLRHKRGQKFALSLMDRYYNKVTCNIDDVEFLGDGHFKAKIKNFVDKYSESLILGDTLCVKTFQVINPSTNLDNVNVELDISDSICRLKFAVIDTEPCTRIITLTEGHKNDIASLINLWGGCSLYLENNDGSILFNIDKVNYIKTDFRTTCLLWLQWCKQPFVMGTGIGFALCAAIIFMMHKHAA